MFIPDEKEAYLEVEVKDVDGDKATVETKDGRVSDSILASLKMR